MIQVHRFVALQYKYQNSFQYSSGADIAIIIQPLAIIFLEY